MFTAVITEKLEIKQNVKNKIIKTTKGRKNKPEKLTNRETTPLNVCGIFVTMNSIQMSHSPEK